MIKKREGEERQRKENDVLKEVMGNCELKCSGLAASVRGRGRRLKEFLINIVMVFEFGSPLWFLRNIVKVLSYSEITFGCGKLFLDCKPALRPNYVCSRFIKAIQAYE